MYEVFVIALLIESLTEYIKDIINGIDFKKIISVVLSLLICFGANLDLFELLGIDFNIPYVGIVLLAIVFSRGSNVVHDLFDKLKK